jgi:BirA family transcriptional regulator, biotin operon repressor / biotin---[acetyl-CoA-carboxylase] ligase
MIKQTHLNECHSTQDILKEQLSRGDAGVGILISCDNQLAGRGRGDHHWDNLTGSLCFSLAISAHPIPSFTAIELSVLLTRFFEGSKLGLKWPNDIWNIEQKKCCGVLVQSYQNLMMAGIGLNLFADHPDYGGVYPLPFEFDKASWAKEISEFILSHRYLDTNKLINDWEMRCWHMSEMVSITEGSAVDVGRFKGLGDYGEALLETDQGLKKLFNGSLRKVY